jgi:hypothetical protein
MGFLDNSGDIILDAVLTDTGRYRLAKGDGSFKIEKFALGDDEIDYNLYNKDHPSGSAYYDLDILQTPILEACTDNASALKSHLITINQTDLLFLPVIKLFSSSLGGGQTFDGQGYFLVCADDTTEKRFNVMYNNQVPAGVFYTATRASSDSNNIIVHQGLDTNRISPLQALSAELVESVYMAEMDNRLGSLVKWDSSMTMLDKSYIDDDQIASYMISKQTGNGTVVEAVAQAATAEQALTLSNIRGPRGTSLKLKIAASLELQTNTYLFEELGSTTTITGINGSDSFYFIDTNVRVVGATTGYRIDIPVRFIKLNS